MDSGWYEEEISLPVTLTHRGRVETDALQFNLCEGLKIAVT